MKVLITGATGYIGRAVAQRLLTAGHNVTGLVRNEFGVRTLTTAGIEPVHGALDDAHYWPPSSAPRASAQTSSSPGPPAHRCTTGPVASPSRPRSCGM
jgi:nucleoside-diphosphate-sugar epimerase